MNYNSKIAFTKRNKCQFIVLVLALITLGTANAQQVSKKKSAKSELKSSKLKTTAYLFAYFTGNSGNEEVWDERVTISKSRPQRYGKQNARPEFWPGVYIFSIQDAIRHAEQRRCRLAA